MNVLNRVLAITIAASAAVLSACVFLAAVNWIAPGEMGRLSWLPNLFAWQTRPALVATGAALFFVAAAALFFFEVRAAGKGRRRMLVKHDELGSVVVSREGVEALATREAARVRGVQKVRSRVDDSKDGLRIEERVLVAPEASIPDLSREVQERIKRAVEHFLGRNVSEVRVDVRPARQVR